MNIGYPRAIRSGELDIDDDVLEDMTVEEKENYISECVWEAAIFYVDTDWEIIVRSDVETK